MKRKVDVTKPNTINFKFQWKVKVDKLLQIAMIKKSKITKKKKKHSSKLYVFYVVYHLLTSDIILAAGFLPPTAVQGR